MALSARRVFRFAPSPNGYLHKGHALSALLNAEAARATDGRFLLRLEDVDITRARPEFDAAILEDLAWLGLEWEAPVWRQSERFEIYEDALWRLREAGMVYPSFLTRSRARTIAATRGPDWPRDPQGQHHYPGTERDWDEARRARAIASGEPYAWRIDMARAVAAAGPLTAVLTDVPGGDTAQERAMDPSVWGDVVLARKEVPSSYHLSVVVDDAAQEVTDVVRGRDLEWATAIHRLVQTLLGLAAPRYHHHRLIRDASGAKLSKSRGAPSLRDLRAKGLTAQDLRSELLEGISA